MQPAETALNPASRELGEAARVWLQSEPAPECFNDLAKQAPTPRWPPGCQNRTRNNKSGFDIDIAGAHSLGMEPLRVDVGSAEKCGEKHGPPQQPAPPDGGSSWPTV